MPRHLQFNPHIRSGYRPLMTIRGCLGSLFYLHNETINILTHGAMPMIAAFVHCLPDALWFGCLLSYCFLSFWGLYKAMRARSPWERRLCFSPPFTMRLLVLTLRCLDIGGGSPNAFPHILLQDLVAVIGGTIGALRIPEKWIPGRVDMALNSHNIMHVMVVLAVCSMHAATLQDLEWMTSKTACVLTTSRFSPIHQEL
ncbi:progestin and adipoQ receptor family member 4 [Cephus cinctus]|uniref:Progestin and adipoQ receptor family member 4 n=1 Tax=Cephus cinctus TaxID=211228 RepID=A0AAJ7BLP5_CEPCN|nr:progestin and adipoQ receptor family member 4 [Cephus cinctus]